MSQPQPARVNLAFIWHMHQPDYQDASSCQLRLPWVRLHGAAAYRDMAALLEAHPGVRATVNLSPTLLDQIRRYQAGAHDSYEALTLRPPAELDHDERTLLVQHFFSAHWANVVERMPAYARLLEKRGREAPAGGWGHVVGRFSDDELRDLQVLFNLAWIGSTAAGDPELAPLLERARDTSHRAFSEEDKRLVLARQRSVLGDVLPAWKRLVARGQVEPLMSPYYHPILPLLVDSQVAKRSMPDARLPERFCFADDARLQISRALERVEREFGEAPQGMWPSELAVSPESVALAGGCGVRYLVSDAEVLFHSLDDRGSTPGRRRLHQPYRVGGATIVFRDGQLSNAIAKEYCGWPDARAAAEDLLRRVGAAAASAHVESGALPLVTIALDGENPWESYPGRGHDFLDALYAALERSSEIRTVKLGEALGELRPAVAIEHLHSGSWIEANYAIWIGDQDKNRGWSLLARARKRLARADSAAELPAAQLERARTHLLCAEGSDWFWWLGEPFSSAEEEIYEDLFRGRLTAAYRACGDSPPADLSRSIEHGGVVETMRQPTAFISPRVDGKRTSFFEWRGAGFYRVPAAGSMYHEQPFLKGLYWGFDAGRLFLRLDPAEDSGREGALGLRDVAIHFELTEAERHLHGALELAPPGLLLSVREPGRAAVDLGAINEVAFAEVVELAIPLARLGLRAGSRHGLTVHFVREGEELARVPRHGVIEVEVPGDDFGD
jgi:alpha-amylase/alpha-mannosidase (GH57 family)